MSQICKFIPIIEYCEGETLEILEWLMHKPANSEEKHTMEKKPVAGRS